ncbi:hypothetical protein KG090_05940 [Carnobacteriaceae bacterium zg-ZUI240]|nr:hypothetical protein [Carnobacteriaceae bacterium zg-ZUI240]
MNTWQNLDIENVINNVERNVLSASGKRFIHSMKPSSDLKIVNKRLDETYEAYQILQHKLHVPFLSLDTFEGLMKKIEMGYILTPEELVEYADFLRGVRLLMQFFKKWQSLAPTLNRYAQGLKTLEHVETAIYETVSKTQVLSTASRELNKVRQRLDLLNKEISKSMGKAVKNPAYKEYLQEALVIEKNGRPTIPIKSSFKNKVPGTIVEESVKGLTTYIEPVGVTKYVEEKIQLIYQEQDIEYRLLSELTSTIFDYLHVHVQNAEIMVQLDVVFARAKYALTYDGQRVSVNKDNIISLKNARHPMITPFVPLNIELGKNYLGLVITGVNAGGKTVVLKTVGLLTAMTMYGLLIPCDEGSHIAIMDHIFVSIGDHQTIHHSLSTFSSEMSTIAYILENATKHSLVLLDEIGTGTDPKEGTALSIAILNELFTRQLLLLVTTHYSEIKDYAVKNPYFETASMQFDEETLTPKYQMLMQTIGESRAFWVAEKMQIPNHIILQAKQHVTNGQFQIPEMNWEGNEIAIQEDKKEVTFSKGDIVFVGSLNKEAIFYEQEIMSHDGWVFVDKQMYKVPLRRLQLLRQSKDLYPKNYNLDLLFVADYQEYKLNKDLQRGSKKAWKKHRVNKEKKNVESVENRNF